MKLSLKNYTNMYLLFIGIFVTTSSILYNDYKENETNILKFNYINLSNNINYSIKEKKEISNVINKVIINDRKVLDIFNIMEPENFIILKNEISIKETNDVKEQIAINKENRLNKIDKKLMPELNNNELKILNDKFNNKYKFLSNYGVEEINLYTDKNLHFYNFNYVKKTNYIEEKISEEIKNVNDNKKEILSFTHDKEKIFLNIYQPIHYSNIYIGVVHYKINFTENIKNFDFNAIYNNFIKYKIQTDVFDPKYLEHLYNDYYIFKFNENESYFDYIKEIFNEKLNKEEYFFVNKNFNLNIIKFNEPSLKNDYFININNNKIISNEFNSFMIKIFINFFISLILSYLIFKELKNRKDLKVLHYNNKAIIDNTEDLIILINNNKVVDGNKSFKEVFQLFDIENIDLKNDIASNIVNMSGFYYPTFLKDKKDKYEIFFQSIVEDISKNNDKESQMIIKNQETHSFNLYNISVKIINNNMNDYIITLKDVTSIKRENMILEKKAHYDKLTGLYNRHSFEEISNKKFKYKKEMDEPISLILFDIDHFKSINDTYGHNVGDEVLKFLGNLIKRMVRQTDVSCRWGGEEFIILFEQNLDNTRQFCEKLRKTIEIESEKTEGIPKFTSSFGAIDLLECNSVKEGVEKSDILLYTAKKKGRNRVIINID